MIKTHRVDYTQTYWFKYTKPEQLLITDANPDHDLELGKREVIGLFYDEDEEKVYLVEKTDLHVVFDISRENLATILKFAIPFKGRVEGNEVRTTDPQTFLDLASRVYSLEVKTEEATIDPRELGTKVISGRPKQVKLDYQLLSSPEDAEKYRKFSALPMSKTLIDLWEKAEDHIGITAKINSKKFIIAECYTQTMIATFRAKGATNKQIAILLCANQLRKINGGTLDYRVVAQATTHELGHYVFDNFLKNSHKLAWRRRVGGLKIHKAQYAHGYDYPWYDEHFAMMAEYMVHGKCARQLQSTVGVDIVEQYFDNRYLRDAPGSKYNKD